MIFSFNTESLGEFGTHVPATKEQSPPPKPKDMPTIPPNMEAEFNEVFSDEFAAQAEAQLGEAMKMLQSENPEIWKQFDQFSSNLGMPSGAAFNPGGTASHGESSTDREEKGRGSERGASLEGVLKDTLEKLKLNDERMAVELAVIACATFVASVVLGDTQLDHAILFERSVSVFV